MRNSILVGEIPFSAFTHPISRMQWAVTARLQGADGGSGVMLRVLTHSGDLSAVGFEPANSRYRVHFSNSRPPQMDDVVAM